MLYMPGRSVSWGGGGVVLPTPAEVTFAPNDHLTHSGALTGAADTQNLSIYVKGRFAVAAAGVQYIFTLNANTEPGVEIFLDANERLRFRLTNTANANLVVTRTSAVNDNTEHEYFFSYNGSAGTATLYKDGSLDQSNVVAPTTGTVDMTGSTTPTIGATATSSDYLNAFITRLAIWDDVTLTVSDAGVQTNMADETIADTLGNNIVDFFGAASDWNAGTNWGTGGNFTMNGAVV